MKKTVCAVLTMVIVVTLSPSICMWCLQWLTPPICMWKTSDASLSHSRQVPDCKRSRVASSLSWGYGHFFDIMRRATVLVSGCLFVGAGFLSWWGLCTDAQQAYCGCHEKLERCAQHNLSLRFDMNPKNERPLKSSNDWNISYIGITWSFILSWEWVTNVQNVHHRLKCVKASIWHWILQT
jgi:hypothetical protein